MYEIIAAQIGVRMALGAGLGNIMRLVTSEMAVVISEGLVWFGRRVLVQKLRGK